MKRPFDELLDVMSENLDKTIENENKNLEFIHQYIIWMIGFSTGALYLLISNVINFKGVFLYGTIKAIIISLSISVICGVVSRFTFFLFQAALNSNSFFLKEAFSTKKRIPDTFEDVSNETDVNRIADLLEFYFDENISEAIELYKNSDEKGKFILLTSFRTTYHNLTEWAKRDYEIALNYIDDTMKKAYGLTDEELTKVKNYDNIRLFRLSSFSLLFLSGLTFIISLIIMVAAY